MLIFGARGRSGNAVVAEAVARGIQVRAFDKKNPSAEELSQAFVGVDAAVIAFGPRPPYTNIFCEESTKTIIRAMEAAGVRRLICVTGAMIGDYPRNRSFAFKLLSFAFRTKHPQGYEDRVKQEEIIKDSSLKWTIVKPPRLSMSEKSVPIQSGENIKIGLLSVLSRKTLAKFIIEEMLKPQYIKKAVFVKNT